MGARGTPFRLSFPPLRGGPLPLTGPRTATPLLPHSAHPGIQEQGARREAVADALSTAGQGEACRVLLDAGLTGDKDGLI